MVTILIILGVVAYYLSQQQQNTTQVSSGLPTPATPPAATGANPAVVSSSTPTPTIPQVVGSVATQVEAPVATLVSNLKPVGFGTALPPIAEPSPIPPLGVAMNNDSIIPTSRTSLRRVTAVK